MQKAEEYMRKVLQDNHWARRAIDVCRLINNGKMDSSKDGRGEE